MDKLPCEYCGCVHPVDPFYCIERLQDQLDQKDSDYVELERQNNYLQRKIEYLQQKEANRLRDAIEGYNF
jgi:cell division protein FtsB